MIKSGPVARRWSTRFSPSITAATRWISHPRTNLQRFRHRVDSLTFVERKPPVRTANPFTSPEPVFDAGEILERIATVQKENLERLDNDVNIAKVYLTTKHTPNAAIEALERLTVEQHVSWKRAVDQIRKLLEE